MASLKAAMKGHQKTHRERGQLNNRKHLGLLEKHKDYVLRAKNFHKRENTLKQLKRKALERNPDEFYFQMVNTKTKGGVHIASKDDKTYTKEQIDLMKTQDLNYLNLQAAKETKKIEKLKRNLHFIYDVDKHKRSHILFTDSKHEEKEYTADTFTNSTDNKIPRKASKLRKNAYLELSSRRERATNIKKARDGLVLQKHLMGKGTVRKKEINGEVSYRWKKIRKR